MENANKPINPSVSSIENGEGNLCAVFTESGKEGLTKREYFAGLAIQGIMSNPDWAKAYGGPDEWYSYIHRATTGAVEIADELLKQLDKQK